MNDTAFRWRALLGVLLLAQPLTALAEDEDKKSKKFFTAESYMKHVKYLASDELGGRGTGSEGIDVAADYIAEQLEAAGCVPAGDDGTFLQAFEVRQRKVLVDDEASIEISGISRPWRLHKDWVPLPFSKAATVEGPLAFAGYGIEAPDHEYNDYADFDPEGKVLLVLRYEPEAEDEDAEFGGKDTSKHSWFRTKARLAADKGAVALLIVNPPGLPEEDELFKFELWNTRQTHKIAVVNVTRKMADTLLRRARMPKLEALVEKLKPGSEPLSKNMKDMTVSLSTGIQYVQANNVVAMLEGDGSTDEIIVIGAHYDHLGYSQSRGGGGVQIHNGADDNASGTAGIIELARVFGEGERPKRNILFVLFAGEELGLLGSKHFVKDPTVDLEKVRAMINLDMIGRLSQDKCVVIGTGSAEEFEEMIPTAAEKAGVNYKPLPGVPRFSDHYPFYAKGIPVIFPFTERHKEYHQPEDDWDLIDEEGAVKVLNLVYDLAGQLANMSEGPTFTNRSAKKKDADVARKEDGNDAPAKPRSSLKVRLGIVPEYAGEDKPGMLVEVVVPGQAAAKGGMKDGDRLVKIDEVEIDNIQDYTEAMKAYKPGDEATIVVLRKGEEVTLEVKFDAPPRRNDGG